MNAFSTPSVAVLAGSRWNRPCAKCGQPITLGRSAVTRSWNAFEADPRVVSRRHTTDGVVEEWAASDRHRCGDRRHEDVA